MDRRKFLSVGGAAAVVSPLSNAYENSLPSTVEELTSRIESVYLCSDGPLGPKTLTDERYTIISGNRVKNEGIGGHEYLSDPETAVRTAWFAFLGHSAGKSGRIYWRMRPALDDWSGHPTNSVYMRFCITDKPELTPWLDDRLPAGLTGQYLGKTDNGTAYSVEIDEKKYIWYGPEPRQEVAIERPGSGQVFRHVHWTATNG